MKLLKIMLCIFVLIWLPSALGICVFPACGVSSAPRRGMTEDGVSGSEKAAGCPDAADFLLCMLAGNLLMWAVFEAVAVPCAFGGAALHTVLERCHRGDSSGLLAEEAHFSGFPVRSQRAHGRDGMSRFGSSCRKPEA